VVYLATELGQENGDKILRVPLYSKLRKSIQESGVFWDTHSSIGGENISAFDPWHIFYQAHHRKQIRGEIIDNPDGSKSQWDPLPYALAAALYNLGVPAESLVIRAGTLYAQKSESGAIKRSPEKFWLEVEIEDLLPPLMISPSLIEVVSLRDQNSDYKRSGTIGWDLRSEGQLRLHAKNQTRVQTNFLQKPQK